MKNKRKNNVEDRFDSASPNQSKPNSAGSDDHSMNSEDSSEDTIAKKNIFKYVDQPSMKR